MNNHKREFIQSDNTHSSIHCQQLNTTLQRQKPASYQRPNNSHRTTTPATTTASVAYAAVSNEYNNTNYDNNIFDCNGGGRHRPPRRDDETRSTRGRRKRSSTLPPSSTVGGSTKTSSSKKIKYKHHNNGTSTSTSVVPNSFDSHYGLGTLSTNSKVSKSKQNYDAIKPLASSVSSIPSVASLNVFEEDADSIVSQAVGGCVDNSTIVSLQEEDDDEEENVDLLDETEGLGMLYLLLGYPVYYC